MKNKMAWIISIALLCSAVAPIEANNKKSKKVIKEKKINKHTPGCNCGGPPPRPPKFWWLKWK